MESFQFSIQLLFPLQSHLFLPFFIIHIPYPLFFNLLPYFQIPHFFSFMFCLFLFPPFQNLILIIDQYFNTCSLIALLLVKVSSTFPPFSPLFLSFYLLPTSFHCHQIFRKPPLIPFEAFITSPILFPLLFPNIFLLQIFTFRAVF